MPRINHVFFCFLLGGTLLLAGCQHRRAPEPPTAVARFLIETEADSAAVVVTLPASGVRVRTAAKPVITEFDLAGVAEVQVDLGRCLLFQLTPAATRDLYRLSAQNLGRRLVLVINGRALGVRVLDRPLEADALFIFLEVPDNELKTMVEDLNRTTAWLQQEAARRG
ncbi:MAG: hypothetical protein H3C27_10695 [Opitutaceae bacterium]|nr:hypothetical protein [Opitutaceae bacterium]